MWRCLQPTPTGVCCCLDGKRRTQRHVVCCPLISTHLSHNGFRCSPQTCSGQNQTISRCLTPHTYLPQCLQFGELSRKFYRQAKQCTAVDRVSNKTVFRNLKRKERNEKNQYHNKSMLYLKLFQYFMWDYIFSTIVFLYSYT